MPHVDFLIANAGHHLEAARPVARDLAARGFECRLVSLCELRGLSSPSAAEQTDGLDVLRLVPRTLRSSPSQTGGMNLPDRKWRSLPRWLFWHLYLAPKVLGWLRTKPDLVVVPNDAAFPYNAICRRLKRRRVRFLLLQEGIRFAETNLADSEIVGQGLSGADAIACWGPTSAEFFRSRGAAPASIYTTGTPRFDRITTTDWTDQAQALSEALPWGARTLAVLTNPIEVWGFCSRREKMDLLDRFLQGLDPLFATVGLRLIFKIHRQESLAEYRDLVAIQKHAGRMTVLSDAPLYPLLELSDAAIVLASTVGLEALLLGKPLGVLEIPGLGFAHDFVASGAGRGISRDESTADQVQELLADKPSESPAVSSYLNRTLSARGRSTREVADLITNLIASAL